MACLALAVFVLIGGLWLIQSVPLVLTALLVPVLPVASGLMEARAALLPFAPPTLFLFLGGFVLADTLRQQGLDQTIAHAVLRAAGRRQGRAMVLLAAATTLLSMWMSNTATAAMMLPVATPPNGLVFATGRVPPAWMKRCGFWLNLGCAAVVSVLVWGLVGWG